MAYPDLTSSANVKTQMQVESGDTDLDAEITAMIPVASLAIMDYCGREFITAASGSTARSFRYNGRGVLDLSPYDVRSVTRVRIDTDTSNPSTLDSDQYRLMPVGGGRDAVYHSLQLRNLSPAAADSGADWRAMRVVEVTSAAWGFSAVPTPVIRACDITVAALIRSTGQHMGDELGIDTVEPSRVAIPGVAKRLLDPYRKRAI
jgi:hypothetical protein